MSQNLILDYYNQKKYSFHLYFDKTLKSLGMEDIHQLRVSIKDLRAFWSLIDMASNHDFNKSFHYNLIYSVFKAAGKVREAQINLKMVRKYDVIYLDKYKDQQKQILKKAIKNLIKTMLVFNMNKQKELDFHLHSVIESLSEEKIVKSSVEIIIGKYLKVAELMKQLPNEGKLHKIRINLKIVKEILQFLNSISVRGLNKLQRRNDLLCKYIGKWHDYVVLQSTLAHLETQKMKKRESKNFKKFINQIKKIKNKEQMKIVNLLNKYITKHQIKSLRKMVDKLAYSNL